MNGEALVLRERGRVGPTTFTLGVAHALRARLFMLHTIPLKIISSKEEKGQTYQFAIKPTGITVQLVVQASPGECRTRP